MGEYTSSEWASRAVVHPYHKILSSYKGRNYLYRTTWMSLKGIISWWVWGTNLKGYIHYESIYRASLKWLSYRNKQINLFQELEKRQRGQKGGRCCNKRLMWRVLGMIELFHILTILVGTWIYVFQLHRIKSTHTNVYRKMNKIWIRSEDYIRIKSWLWYYTSLFFF